jgi:hypothetical protein
MVTVELLGDRAAPGQAGHVGGPERERLDDGGEAVRVIR